MKHCNTCGLDKPETDFYKHIRTNDGLCARCKQCDYEKHKLYRETNQHRVSLYRKIYYASHKEIELEQMKTYRAKQEQEKCIKQQEQKIKQDKVLASKLRRKEMNRALSLKKKFGISVEQYDNMLIAQNGVCAICHGLNGNKHNLAVDHDHKTGAIRQLLCQRCNTSIGLLEEDTALLQKMIDYIKMFSQRS